MIFHPAGRRHIQIKIKFGVVIQYTTGLLSYAKFGHYPGRERVGLHEPQILKFALTSRFLAFFSPRVGDSIYTDQLKVWNGSVNRGSTRTLRGGCRWPSAGFTPARRCLQFLDNYCWPHRSVVCVSVCVLGTRVSCAKTAEPIEMPFGGRLV